jgi:hypothetical protein
MIEGKNITVSRGVSRVAAHLQITQTMVEDFLVDPVLGLYVIMGIKLDVFQAYAARVTWWVPNVIDSSGFGTGKSFRIFALSNLRALLIPGQQIVAYYQTFQAMKDIYWKNYENFGRNRAPIFDAQLGRMSKDGDEEGKDNTRGPACYQQAFKNGSCIYGPAPNWLQGAKGQAGLTFNEGIIDEWTKVETMTPKGTKVQGDAGNLLGGIDQQILGRIRNKSFNQYHMLWKNHIVFTATAEAEQHPAYQRVKQFKKEIAAGNPEYAIITTCFKDFSNVRTERDIRIEDCECKSRKPEIANAETGKTETKCPKCGGEGRVMRSTPGKAFKEEVPDWNIIKMMKGRSTTYFRREALGLWARETKGYYSEENLANCVTAGINAATEVVCTREGLNSRVQNSEEVRYFLGVDSAPAQSTKADDGGLATLRLRPRPGLGRAPTSANADWLFEAVWAYRVRGQRVKPGEEGAHFYAQRTGDWSGLIHLKHQHFRLDGIMMDSQGGGQLIWPELNKVMQRIDGVDRARTPITTEDDREVGHAHRILCMFLKKHCELVWPILGPTVDCLLTAAHQSLCDAVRHAEILFPKPFNDRPAAETAAWPLEQKWALKNLDAARHQMANIQVATKEDGDYLPTRNGAFTFSASGRKDLAYALLYAYVRALIWLKNNELDLTAGGGEYTGIYVVK